MMTWLCVQRVPGIALGYMYGLGGNDSFGPTEAPIDEALGSLDSIEFAQHL